MLPQHLKMKRVGALVAFLCFLCHSTRAQTDDCYTLDLAILIDSSATVSRAWYAADGVLEFTRRFVRKFNVGENNVRVSIMEFSETTNVLHRFTSPQIKGMIADEVLPGVLIDPHYVTKYQYAFKRTYEEIFARGRGQRNFARNVTVLITDGTYYRDVKSHSIYEAEKLLSQGVDLYIFAYGVVDRSFMLDMVRQDASKFRNFGSPAALTAAVDSLFQQICPSSSGFNGINPSFSPAPRPAQSAFAFAVPPLNTGQVVAPATTLSCPLIDLALLIDSSSSVYRSWYATNGVLQFARRFVKRFNVGDNGVRISIQEFSSVTNVFYRFTNVQDKDTIADQVLPAMLIDPDFRTRYELAFQTCLNDQFYRYNGQRDAAKKVAVLITDGASYPDRSYSKYEANRLQEANVTLYIFAYGNVERQLMRDMVKGDSRKVHFYDSPAALTAAVNFLSQQICPSTPTINSVNQNFNGFPRPDPVMAADFPSASIPQVPPPFVQQRPPTSTGCSQVDLVFLMDTTFKIFSSWWGTGGTFDFIERLMRRFGQNSGIRTGAQLVTDGTQTLWYLNSNMGMERKIQTTRTGFPYSATSMPGYAESLSWVANQQFKASSGDRPTVPNVLIVIAHDYLKGAATPEVMRQVNALRGKGVKTFAISWGNPNRALMNSLVSGATSQVLLSTGRQSPINRVEMIYNGICSMV